MLRNPTSILCLMVFLSCFESFSISQCISDIELKLVSGYGLLMIDEQSKYFPRSRVMLKVVIHRTQVISDETRQIANGRRCDLTSPLQFRVIIIKVVHRIVTEWAHYCSSWDRLTHRATFRLKPENAELVESWKVLRYCFKFYLNSW